MSKIIPKLNLNKTPQLVENNSLVYAKNIKLSDDGVISPDTSLSPIYNPDINNSDINNIKYKGHIVGLNNTVYIFKEDTTINYSEDTHPNDKVKIFKYNEITKKENKIECAWKYSGGKIDGLVTTNNIGDEILTICEYDVDGINVPIKHINLNKSKDDTEESIYTQNPNVLLSNILNITLVEGIQIPNGVYQFFIRYEIRKDFYTNWMPCSKDIYVGKNQQNCTIQGSIRYVDTNYDSPTSFRFEIEHILDNINFYKKFQLGFILSSNDSVVARSWKHFNLHKENNIITFDYDKASIEEINIDDLLQTNYEIFNVKNITYFKNKEYISNYIETDFNKAVDTKDIKITLRKQNIDYKINTNNINVSIDNIQQIDYNDIDNPTENKELINIQIDKLEKNNKWGSIMTIDNIIIDKIDKIEYDLSNVYNCTDTNGNQSLIHVNYNNIIKSGNINSNENFNNIIPRVYSVFVAGQTANYFAGLWESDGNDTYKSYDNIRFDDNTNMTIKEAIDKWVFLLKKYYKETYGDCIINSINVDGENIQNSQIIIKSENLKQKVKDILTENNIELNQTSEIIVNYNLLTFENYEKSDKYINDTFTKITISLEAKQDTKEIKYILPLLQNNEIEINRDIINYTTLMPKVNYEFYIHFVKRNGIITNGIKINNILNDVKIPNITDLTNLPYYPTYTNKNELAIIYPDIAIENIKDIAPKDSVAWFVSIYNPTNMTCRGFNFRQDDEYNYIECIEADALLHNLINNIPIYKQYNNGEFTLVSTKGEYLSSSQTKVVDYFGNTGVIRWPIKEGESITTFTNISSTIKIPISNNRISGYIYFRTNMYNENKPFYENNFAGNNIYTIIHNIKIGILTAIHKDYVTHFDINITFPNTTLPIIYDKYDETGLLIEEGLFINNNKIDSNSFYNINNNYEIVENEIDVEDEEGNTITVKQIIEINEDEYEHNLKQLEIYNTTINTTRLAAEVNSKTVVPQGNLDKPNACRPDKDASNIQPADIAECINPDSLNLLNMNVGSAGATVIADASSNAIKEINSIKLKIDEYNDKLSKVKDAYVVKYIKNGKITYITKEGIISGKEILDSIKYISITISTKANELGNNPISFIDFDYYENKIPLTNNTFNTFNTLKPRRRVRARSTEYSYWIINNSSNSNINNDNKQLTKITPFIKIDTDDSTPTDVKYYDYKNMNLPGFLCLVEKPDYKINNEIYVSGTDVYEKKCFLDLEDVNDNEDNSVKLPEEIGKGIFSLEKYEGYIPYRMSNLQATISNFNLNMLSLREDLILQLRSSSEIYNENGEEKETIYNQTFKGINSLVVSSIYKLPTMYKDYIKKYYYIYNEDNIYKFDNTVRSSNVNVDESHINVYRFKAEDYYHVPANKGFIVKMFTILDNIYIHCQHALYNFVGANSLTSTEGNVALKETDVFDSGIKALLDSKNGFAGISEKHHGLVTYSSYIWYDYLAKTIYSIDSQTGIKDITQSIKKLIHNHNISDVSFVADETNTRFFVNFRINDDSICLSYDFRNKDFISLHDLDFKEGFNTRSNTYLVSNTDKSQSNTIYQLVPYIEYKDADNRIIQNFIRYEKCYKRNLIHCYDDNIVEPTNNIVNACFDVIYNENYEIIKSLEYINWICGKITNFNNDINFAEEYIDYNYPGNDCRIYNELTKTDLIDLSSRSNDTNLNQDNNIIKPRFNKGIWSLNYFRNINDNDIDRTNNVKLKYHIEDSLLYGKYFVVRFVFNNTNFKFENVTFKVNIYE